MLFHMLSFQARLMLLKLMPLWYQNTNQDKRHSHFRRFSDRYQNKKKIVKYIWAGTGVITLLFPYLPTLITLSAFSTFLSFAILDES